MNASLLKTVRSCAPSRPPVAVGLYAGDVVVSTPAEATAAESAPSDVHLWRPHGAGEQVRCRDYTDTGRLTRRKERKKATESVRI